MEHETIEAVGENEMKRSRMPRKGKKARKERMPKDEKMSLSGVLSDISQALKEGFVAMGGKEAIHNFEDDHLKKNLKIARQMIKSHPEGHLLLKVELEEEPAEGAGRYMLMRAEDFAHFDRVEVEDVDSGEVFTVSRRSVVRIIGRIKLEADPEFIDEGYGVRDETPNPPPTGEAVSGGVC